MIAGGATGASPAALDGMRPIAVVPVGCAKILKRNSSIASAADAVSSSDVERTSSAWGA